MPDEQEQPRIVEVNIPGAERAKLEAEIETRLRMRYDQLLNIWKQDEFDKFAKDQDALIQTRLQEYLEKWKEDQKPPSIDQIQQLLDQEYNTFTVPVTSYDDEGKSTIEVFVLRELPQSIEKKLYKQFKDRILTKAGALQALAQATMDSTSQEEKIKTFLELFDESFELLSEAVSLILNPFGKRKVQGIFITKEWVQENISSNRQWQIMEAQLMVNRIKDFFSKLSQSGQMTQMTLEGLNYQQLLQQRR